MGGMLFGYDSRYINGVLGNCQFKHDFGHMGWLADNDETCNGYLYDSWRKSLVVSILSAGTFVGALLAGSISDKFGRRMAIILGTIVYLVGVIIQVAAAGMDLLIVGRAIAGLGVGVVSASSIMFISEVSPATLRGSSIGAYQLFITLGLLFAACVAIGTKAYTDSGAYRIPIGLQFLWALILIVGMLFITESPRYFVRTRLSKLWQEFAASNAKIQKLLLSTLNW